VKLENIERNYNMFYRSINFERAGLFELLKGEYSHDMVLYPGCSIHVTPSFFFPHVVYIDKSDLSREFFADTGNVTEFVSRHKKYKRMAYIEYHCADYKNTGIVPDTSFDLVLSIYSDAITENCKRFLKKDGVVIANSYENSIEKTLQENDLELIAIINKKGERYLLEKNSPLRIPVARQSKNFIKNGAGFEYRDVDPYYVFRKKA
jgi:hypothetical protein